MPLTIKNKFDIGDIVYLVSDGEQYKRQITGIQVNANGLYYVLACNGDESLHFEIEISKTKAVV